MKKEVDALREKDVRRYPVWEFVEDDPTSDTLVTPVSEPLPLKHLDGRLVCTEVILADGHRVPAIMSNIRPRHAVITRHFVTLTVLVGGKHYHLSRY